MNWFETDDGFWFNLDLIRVVIPPSGYPAIARLGFTDGRESIIGAGSWGRLTLQLRNSQRPCDRTPEPPEGVKP